MPKTFKTSSYDRVCNKLMSFPEYGRVLENFREHLNGLKLDSCDFIDMTREGERVVIPCFNFINAAGGRAFERRTIPKSPTDLYFDYNRYISDELIYSLADTYFGTKFCPTFNCSKEKVVIKLTELTKARLFESPAGEQFILDTKTRLLNEILAASEKDEFKKRMDRSYELLVIREFRDLLKIYGKKVGPHVLKEAFDSYVTHEIMDA